MILLDYYIGMTRKEKAIELINSTRLSVKQIHESTGLEIAWLNKFKRGEFKSEDKIDILYEFLKRRK